MRLTRPSLAEDEVGKENSTRAEERALQEVEEETARLVSKEAGKCY